jgi:hypothetical protein
VSAVEQPQMSEDLRGYVLRQLHAGKSREQISDEMPPDLRAELLLSAVVLGTTPRYLLNCATNVLGKMEAGGVCVGCETMIVGRPAALYSGEFVNADGLHSSCIGAMCSKCVERYQSDAEFAGKINAEGEATLTFLSNPVGGHA